MRRGIASTVASSRNGSSAKLETSRRPNFVGSAAPSTFPRKPSAKRRPLTSRDQGHQPQRRQGSFTSCLSSPTKTATRWKASEQAVSHHHLQRRRISHIAEHHFSCNQSPVAMWLPLLAQHCECFRPQRATGTWRWTRHCATRRTARAMSTGGGVPIGAARRFSGHPLRVEDDARAVVGLALFLLFTTVAYRLVFRPGHMLTTSQVPEGGEAASGRT